MESIESKLGKKGLLSKENEDENNLANERFVNGLSLRKRKINSILSKQRGFERFKNEGHKDYNLEKEKIEIPDEIKAKKYDDVEIFLKTMKTYIKSTDKEYNKYALYCIRVQTISNEGSNNKNDFSELLIKYDFISDILNLIQKNIDNLIIINEGLWILINVLYYQNNNIDLVLFLSNQQCIQLYINILNKNDNNLRLNVYWLLSNLLFNDNMELTNQIIFHLYMSSLFRLYIFKDLVDKNSKLREEELNSLIVILSKLSDFINKTFLQLKSYNIKNFIEYNSNVDYNSIKENNEFLFHNSMKIFLDKIEYPNLTTYCLIGLSKLTNYLDDTTAFNDFFKTGICRKIVKEQIKINEDALDYAVQIIGNYLSCLPDAYFDPIFMEETANYFSKILKTYPNIQGLKRDIFWSAGNISACVSINSGELLAKSGLIEIALNAIHTENDLVVYEALNFLLGFIDPQNMETIINHQNFDYINNLILCLKNIHNKCTSGKAYNSDILEKILTCFGFLFEIGSMFKMKDFENKFIIDFEKNGGFELLEIMFSICNSTKEIADKFEALLKFKNEN